MGCFSWLDCDKRENRRPIRIGEKAYLLVPKKFQNDYGKVIETYSYDGYGHFCGCDVYDLVAEWNREYLSEDMLQPVPDVNKFGGLWSYEKDKLRKKGVSEEEVERLDREEQQKHWQNAVDYRQYRLEQMLAFKDGEEIEDLRDIGIAIACYDEQNANLPYPIKISRNEKAVYEDCEPCLSDPDQGCF